MSFNFFLFRGIRLLLFPFSVLVWMYLRIRNFLYNKNFFRSTYFNLPVICVGNLSLGGTGKSPMVEYLLHLLHEKFPVATLSRGYKRKTRGYLLAGASSTALDIGDEPMQFHLKFPDVAIAVGEERVLAIPQLLHDRPQTKAIILDDAFQHRAIKAGLNILLTDYNNPYWFDFYLPTGELRDNKRSAHRAHLIVVTKCPPNLSTEQKEKCLKLIKPQAHQQVFFTCIEYGTPYHIIHKTEKALHTGLEALLVCGIANPVPLKTYIEEHTAAYFEKNFSDHHIFSIDDWKEVRQRFEKLEGSGNMILTTEKDAVRLVKFGSLLNEEPLYVLPIKTRFLFDEALRFNQKITRFIENFNPETEKP